MQQDLEYIYQVYQDKNFTKAAEKLYISQPALSMAIKKIEDQIGMPLFDRSARPLKLTAAGEAYIEHINQIRFLESELELQLQDIRNAGTGHICIGGSHYLNAYILPDLLREFSIEYPGIVIDIREASSATLSQWLEEQKLDLTFNCNEDFMRDFERYPAFEDHVLLAVPKNHPANIGMEDKILTASEIANGRHLSPDCPMVELRSFCDNEYIILTSGNNLHDRSLQLFQEAGFTPRIRMELSQLVTAYHLADAGMAATFVSDRLVVPGEDRLSYYKLDSELTTRQFYILLPKRRYTSIAVRTFIKFFSEHISSM